VAVKGNVVDMAVGIIIGAAFTSVVQSLVKDVLTPPIGLAKKDGNFNDVFLTLADGKTPGPYNTLEAAQAAGAVTVNLGVFINACISFLIVAFALFIVIKGINR